MTIMAKYFLNKTIERRTKRIFVFELTFSFVRHALVGQCEKHVCNIQNNRKKIQCVRNDFFNLFKSEKNTCCCYVSNRLTKSIRYSGSW